MRKAVAGAAREQREARAGNGSPTGRWCTSCARVGESRRGQPARPPVPRLTYTEDDAAGLTSLEPRPEPFAGRVTSSASPCSTAMPSDRVSGGRAQAADFFGNDDVLYLMEDMATGEIRLSILWSGSTSAPA